jgi:ferrous iron transport protein B
MTIPNNLANLGHALVNPIAASAKENELSQTVYGMMAQKFDGQAGAYAYLLFVLLYMPCVSTIAAIRQEANRSWMWFSVTWSTLLAYSAAVVVYQLARFSLHPLQSILWCSLMAGLILMFIYRLQGKSSSHFTGGRNALTNP